MTPVLRRLFLGFPPDAPTSVGAFLIFSEIPIAAVKSLCYNDLATQFYKLSLFIVQTGLRFYCGKNADPVLANPFGRWELCGSNRGFRFSVRGSGCALFYHIITGGILLSLSH